MEVRVAIVAQRVALFGTHFSAQLQTRSSPTAAWTGASASYLQQNGVDRGTFWHNGVEYNGHISKIDFGGDILPMHGRLSRISGIDEDSWWTPVFGTDRTVVLAGDNSITGFTQADAARVFNQLNRAADDVSANLLSNDVEYGIFDQNSTFGLNNAIALGLEYLGINVTTSTVQSWFNYTAGSNWAPGLGSGLTTRKA